MLSTVIIGFLAALIMQWVKNTPVIPWIKPEHTKALQAGLIIFSTLVGLLVAASEPGGLAAVNWEHTLTVLFENAVIVYGAAVVSYVGLVKPNAK